MSCRNRPRVGSAVVITVMWILVTIHASISWAYLDNIYIQHGETREAQLGALFSIQTGELFPLAVTNSVMALISVLLADVTMVSTYPRSLSIIIDSVDLAMLGAIRQETVHRHYSWVIPCSSIRYVLTSEQIWLPL